MTQTRIAPDKSLSEILAALAPLGTNPAKIGTKLRKFFSRTLFVCAMKDSAGQVHRQIIKAFSKTRLIKRLQKAGYQVIPVKVAPAGMAGLEAVMCLAPIILKGAMQNQASEIYVESQQQGVVISYRVGGELKKKMEMPIYVLEPLMDQFKAMGEISTDEWHIPQEGYFHMIIEGKDYDVQHNLNCRKQEADMHIELVGAA